MYRLFVTACLLFSVHAKSPEEIKHWFMQKGMECNTDYPISPEEMLMLQKHKIPESKNVKCLMACVYRKTTWLTPEGTFDIDKAIAMIEKEMETEEKKTNGKKALDTCRTVNDEAVSDGKAGCERAFLLSQCLIENAPKFGFDLKHVHL